MNSSENGTVPRSSKGQNDSTLLSDDKRVDFSDLAAALPDLVCRVDRNGFFTEFVHGTDLAPCLDLDRLMGRRLSELFPKEVAEQCNNVIAIALANNAMQVFGFSIRTETRFTEFETRVVPDGDESVLLVSLEITDRKRAEESLERRVRERSAGLMQANESLRAEIADREKADEEMRTNEERLSLVVQATRVGVWDCNLVDGGIWWNEQYNDIFGVRPDNEAESWDWWIDRIHPEDRERVVQSFRDTIEGTVTRWHAEYRFQGEDETYINVLDSAHITRDLNGKGTRILGAMLDVTAFKQAEQALLHSNQRKDEFLAMLAHELRNPLAPIRTAIDVMALEELDNPTIVNARTMIHKQVEHLVRLVDDLLDVSRITCGKIVLKKAEVDLADIIGDAVALVRSACKEKEQMLSVALPNEAIHLLADPTRLVQVVSNLLSNAVRYTPINGRIELSTSVEDSNLMIRIRDNGEGISAEDIPYVFDLFVQSKRGLDRSSGGLGIGLTLARRIVQQHGGTITVESAGEGLGCEFTVCLPLGSLREVQTTSVESLLSAEAAGGLRVLVVDDLPEAAESMQALLSTLGYEVYMAFNGAAAIVKAGACKPHVMLVDIGMPGLNGYDVARQLRSLPGSDATLLVAVSGYCSEDDLRESSQAGFDFHLAKPVSAEQILEILQGHQPQQNGEALAD